jgi:hypothetical protein
MIPLDREEIVNSVDYNFLNGFNSWQKLTKPPMNKPHVAHRLVFQVCLFVLQLL